MWSDPAFLAIAVPGAMLAGFSKGGFGSGAAFAATALIALRAPPGAALGVMLPVLMLIDLALLPAYRGRWSGGEARALILGALPGVAAAALLWRAAPDDLFRLLIGAMSLLFVAWQVARGRGWIPIRPAAGAPRPLWGGFWGAVAGFTSFVSHAGGPPVAVYLLGRGLPKTTYQATSVLVFWAINGFKAVPYALLGIFTAQTLGAALVLAPFALVGAWLGVRAHGAVPERLFFALVYTLLVLTGLKLIFDALT